MYINYIIYVATSSPEKMVARHELSYPEMPCDIATLNKMSQTIDYNIAELECIQIGSCQAGDLTVTGCDDTAGRITRRSSGVDVLFELVTQTSTQQKNLTQLGTNHSDQTVHNQEIINYNFDLTNVNS